MEKKDNVILVGQKPLMAYVTAVVMQFTSNKEKEVIVKARGKFISKAVDIAEVVSKRFLKDQTEVGDIKVDSEDYDTEGKDKKPRKV